MSNDDTITVILTYTRAEARRVASAIRYFDSNVDGLDDDHDRMLCIASAIEFANKPPKPSEPTGLGAVVKDREGRKFIRTGMGDFPWTKEGDAYQANAYHWTEQGGLDGSYAVEVLSKGVTDAV